MSNKSYLFPAGVDCYKCAKFKKSAKTFFKFSVFGLFFCLLNSWIYASTNVYISKVSVHKNNGNDCIGSASTDVSEPQGTANNIFWGQDAALIEFDRPDTPTSTAYPGPCLSLCAEVRCTNLGNPLNPLAAPIEFPIEYMRFEVFKFLPGTNPMNPSSAAPLRTIYMYNVGTCPADDGGSPVDDYLIGDFCAAWDGSYNIDGITDWGKTNGNFGFRATVNVNWVTQSQGSVNVTMTTAYPGQDQFPMRVDVTNVHSLITSPTIVGTITGIAAQPYSIRYRLAKDSNVLLQIIRSGADPANPPAGDIYRTIVNNEQRTGEGIPNGTLINGDSWSGRHNNGKMLNAGDYTVRILAQSEDRWGVDWSQVKYRTITLDPLRATDFRVKALGSSSVDTAEITFVSTEPATYYLNIYTPGTKFVTTNTAPPVIVGGSGTLVRQLVEQKPARQDVIFSWDGFDTAGNPVADGDYVYAIYGEMPGYNPATSTDITIRTQQTYVGTVPVSRGFVVTSDVAPSSTVIGQNPTAGGLDPFKFQYTLSRDCEVSLKIYDRTGITLVKTVVDGESKPANFANTETWDGRNNEGFRVATGTYLVVLEAIDAFSPAKIARSTALFPIDLFRVVDVVIDPLLGDAEDQAIVQFTMTQPMIVNLDIYPPGTVVDATNWPPTIMGTPAPTPVKNLANNEKLPGRSIISQYWDGLLGTSTTQMADDGEYIYVLTARAEASVAQYPDTNGAVDGYTDFDLINNYYAHDKTTGTLEVARGKVFLQNIAITPFAPETILKEAILLPPYKIGFEVTRIASVDIDIISSVHCANPPYINNVCRNLVDGEVFLPLQQNTATWNGRDDLGNILPEGDYTIRITASDYPDASLHDPTVFTTAIEHKPFRLYDLQITDITPQNPDGKFTFTLSESMKYAVQIFETDTVLDGSGDPLPPIEESLVKVLVGFGPRTLNLEQLWDGTDRSGKKVPDGKYPFRVVTSTRDAAIDNITGEIIGGLVNVADLDTFFTLQEVIVNRGQSLDVCADFKETIKIFPNPIKTPQATVWMTKLPTPGFYKMTIYNIARDKIYSHDWGYLVPAATHPNVEFIWPKTNASGRRVARGVYFVVFELKNSFGGREICQTVKKVLIP